MSDPSIQHKFVKGLKKANPGAEIYRKSVTWKNFHADSGVIVDKKAGYQYIIVALVEHPKGADVLARFAAVVDQIRDRNFLFVGQSMAKRPLCVNNHVDTGCCVVSLAGIHRQRGLGQKN